MEYRGIDVSSWQGVIDWKKVTDHGTEFAIIRITEAGNAIDRYFERNYAGCMEYRIPTGLYKFSYALSIDEVRREAEKVIEVLKVHAAQIGGIFAGNLPKGAKNFYTILTNCPILL